MIWFEYVMETGRLAHEKGLYNVLVTNGFVNPDPLDELLGVVDAMNIDLKAFNGDFYRELCGAEIEPVKRTIVRAARDCHVELTTLLIPGRNDDGDDIADEARWIAAEVGEDVPVHLSAYHPAHNLHAPATPAATLLKARGVFRRYLKYVYLGNVLAEDGNETVCEGCGATVIERRGYRVGLGGMSEDGRCAACGGDLNVVTGACGGGETD